MSWFKKNTGKIEEKTLVASDGKIVVQCNKPEPEPEEWIVVKGFKGMDFEMQGYNNFQYEIGKTYQAEGEIEVRRNGFHFCLTLDDVLKSHFSWLSHDRFFEVKGLVRKKDYEDYHLYHHSIFSGSYKNNMIVAKEITILRELTPEELYDTLEIGIPKQFFLHFYQGKLSFEDCLIRDFRKSLEGKYSDTFITCLIQKIQSELNQDSTPKFQKHLREFSTFDALKNKAIALFEEGVSPDMRAYLLLK